MIAVSAMAIQMYNIRNETAPPYIQELFETRTTTRLAMICVLMINSQSQFSIALLRDCSEFLVRGGGGPFREKRIPPLGVSVKFW